MNKEKIKKIISDYLILNSLVDSIQFVGSINKKYFNEKFSDIDVVIYLKEYENVFKRECIMRFANDKEVLEKKINKKIGLTIFSDVLKKIGFYNIKLLDDIILNHGYTDSISTKYILVAEDFYRISKFMLERRVKINERVSIKTLLRILLFINLCNEGKDSVVEKLTQFLKKGESISESDFNDTFDYVTSTLVTVINRDKEILMAVS